MDNEKIVKLEEPIITSYNAYAHLLALMQTWYGGTEAFQNWFVNQYLILKGFYHDLGTSFLFDDPFNENRMLNRFVDSMILPREFIIRGKIDILDFLKEAITKGYAVNLWLEQYYIPQNKRCFQKESGIHDPLIYGYNKEGFLLADFYDGKKYSLDNIVNFECIRNGFYCNDADDLEASQNINNTLIVCAKPRSFMEYEYDPDKLKYAISRHLKGGRFINGYKQDYIAGTECYDFWIELLLKFPQRIEIRAAHVFLDHKKAASRAIEYLMCNGRIRNGEQLRKEFHALAELARLARNMAIKYNIKKDDYIIEKLIAIYRDMKQADKECFEKFYDAIDHHSG